MLLLEHRVERPSDRQTKTDKAVRDKAVESLEQFLVARGDDLLDDKELMKLWKGLFFCTSFELFRL